MQTIRSIFMVLAVRLNSAVGLRANIVKQPGLKFGLGSLLRVAISPDRQWMATSGKGGAFIWNFTNGTIVHRLHSMRVGALCFSPDSQVLLTGDPDQTVRAWDVVSGVELRSLTGHVGNISGPDFAPDGESLVSATKFFRVGASFEN